MFLSCHVLLWDHCFSLIVHQCFLLLHNLNSSANSTPAPRRYGCLLFFLLFCPLLFSVSFPPRICPIQSQLFCLFLNFSFPSIYSTDKFHHHSSSYFVLPVQLFQRLVGKSEKGVLLQCLPQIKKKKPIEFNKYSYRNRRIKPVEQKGKLRQVCIYVYGDIIWWLATWQRWYNHPIEKAHLYCRWCWRN